MGCVFFLLVGATNSFKQLYTGFAKHCFLQNFLYRIAFYYYLLETYVFLVSQGMHPSTSETVYLLA